MHTSKIPLLNDLLNIIDKGTEITSPIDLIICTGQPSGPEDLPLCKFVILFRTTSGVISIESITGGEQTEWTVGIVVVSSTVKTLEKYSLKIVAFSALEQTVDPSEQSSSAMLGCIFILELMYRQKALGREFTF